MGNVPKRAIRTTGYANIEISYLLERMEAYDGVTILATNPCSSGWAKCGLTEEPAARMIRSGRPIGGCWRWESLPVQVKVRLTAHYVQLNPVALRTRIDAKAAQLWKIVR